MSRARSVFAFVNISKPAASKSKSRSSTARSRSCSASRRSFHSEFSVKRLYRERAAAEESKRRLDESGRFRRPIVTQIMPAAEFYPAEE